MSTQYSDLFFEVVSMMGMREYNILPFNFLLERKQLNARYEAMGQLDKIRHITDQELLPILRSYRYNTFGIDDAVFEDGKKAFSMIFEHSFNGMWTVVVFSNSNENTTSKDELTIMIKYILQKVIKCKTNGMSEDSVNPQNKTSAIFILTSDVSSYSKPFLEQMNSIEIILESHILSRVYDNCLQSHIRCIGQNQKNKILAEVALESHNIPSISKSKDILCKILGLKVNDLMVATRVNISPEEIVQNATFIRNIKN